MEGWLGLLVPDEQLLVDQLDLAGVVLVEPRRIRDRAMDLLEEERALVATLLETWSEGETVDPALGGGLHARLRRSSSAATPVLAMPAAESPSSRQLTVGKPRGRGRRRRPPGRAPRGPGRAGAQRAGAGRAGEPPRRLRRAARRRGPRAPVVEEAPVGPGVAVAVAPLGRGVLLLEQGIAVLAESDITGRRAAHRAARARAR